MKAKRLSDTRWEKAARHSVSQLRIVASGNLINAVCCGLVDKGKRVSARRDAIINAVFSLKRVKLPECEPLIGCTKLLQRIWREVLKLRINGE